MTRPEPDSPDRTGPGSRLPLALLGAGALLVVWTLVVAGVLVPLAFSRHLHVDEIQVAYNAALLGIHELPEALNFHAPMIVPLSWLASGHATTWPFLMEARALFLVLFVVDLLLVAAFAPGVRGWLARAAVLLGITLVEPFWRHGFEIRHDVLLLAGTLGLFACAQAAASGARRSWPLLVAGLLAGWLQLNSLKAILVWPAGLLMVLIAAASAKREEDGRAGFRRPVLPVLVMALGLALGVASGLLLLASAGLADDYGRRIVELGSAAGESSRFAPGERLLGLLVELPHLTVLALAALGFLGVRVRRGDWRAEMPSLLTAGWFGLQVVVLHLNPVPFTYNFIHVLPFLYLLAVDGVVALGRAAPRARAPLAALALGIASFTCILSWRGDGVGENSGRGPTTAHRSRRGPDFPARPRARRRGPGGRATAAGPRLDAAFADDAGLPPCESRASALSSRSTRPPC